MEGAPDRPLIRTTYRSPISKELSYPLGAEIVSAALTGVPQFEVLTLRFRSSQTPVDLKKRIARGTDVVVFSASYYRPRWPRPNGVTEEWDLSVYAVPRAFKAEARRLLTEVGLNRVRSRLSSEHPPIWFYGMKECTVLVRFDDGVLSVRED